MLICQITDLHIKAARKKSYGVVDTTACLEACVDAVQSLPQAPDLVVVTGDLVDFGRADEYAALRPILDRFSQPLYLLPGNHDDREMLRQTFADHTYLPALGQKINYVIEDWPLRLVMLDTVVPGESGGALDRASLEWLESTLAMAPDRPTLVAMHHPPFKTGIGHMDEIGLSGIEALEHLIARHSQIERIICGHLHRSIVTGFGGTIASTCPSPAHQVMLDLSPKAPSRFVMEPPGFQLHAWLDGQLVSHTAVIGHYPGPYPFYGDEGLID